MRELAGDTHVYCSFDVPSLEQAGEKAKAFQKTVEQCLKKSGRRYAAAPVKQESLRGRQAYTGAVLVPHNATKNIAILTQADCAPLVGCTTSLSVELAGIDKYRWVTGDAAKQ